MANSTYTLPSTFAAFRYYNYRLWFIGQLVSMVGTWMQNTAQGYLVYTLTGSSAYLGYVGLSSGLPSFLFMLYGGLIADRVPRRALLIVTQSAMMILAFILAALVFLNMVQPWHILVLSFLLGIANAFDTPARQSLIIELVDRQDMTNAIALNGTMFNLSVIVGPASAGIIYALVGPAWCFTLNGISFIAVIIALAMMRISNTAPAQPPATSATKAIIEGFTYVFTKPLILTLSFSTLYYNLFGFSLVTLIPAWAVEILKGDVTTNGLLLTSRGVGAVIGGLLLASVGSKGYRGKMWSAASLLMPMMVAGFALSRIPSMSLVLMGMVGFALIIIMNNSNAMVQSNVPDVLRGRVMGFYSLMFMGGGPLGSFFVGVAADQISETNTVLICAGMLALYAAAIWLFNPQVRAMR